MMYYVNGDSYSERHWLGGAWSDYLDLEAHNSAQQGSSNDRIIRTSIEDILRIGTANIKKVIIGFSFFMREEVWWNNQLVTLDSLRENRGDAQVIARDKYIDLHINHQTVHHYTYIWMMAHAMENLGLDYLFFSAADNSDRKMLDWDYLKSLSIYQDVVANENIIDLSSFSIEKWGRENDCNMTSTGHFADLNGHEKFGNFLLERYL